MNLLLVMVLPWPIVQHIILDVLQPSSACVAVLKMWLVDEIWMRGDTIAYRILLEKYY
jgi:hypothetical protein